MVRAHAPVKRRFAPLRLDKEIGGPLSEYLDVDDNDKFVGVRKWIHVDNSERTFSPDFHERVKLAMTRSRERAYAKNRERIEVQGLQLVSYYPQQGDSLDKTRAKNQNSEKTVRNDLPISHAASDTSSDLDKLNELKFLHSLLNDPTRTHVMIDKVQCSLIKLRALCTDVSRMNMSSGIKESRANESQTEATVTFASVGCQTGLNTDDTVDSVSTNTTRSKQITPQTLMSLPLTVTPRPLMSLPTTPQPLISLPVTPEPVTSLPVMVTPTNLPLENFAKRQTFMSMPCSSTNSAKQGGGSIGVDEPLQTNDNDAGSDGKSHTLQVQTVPPLQLSQNPQSSAGLLSLPSLPIPIINPSFWTNYSQGNNSHQQIPDLGLVEAETTAEAKYQQAKQWRPKTPEQASLLEQAKKDMYQVLLVNKGCMIRRLIKEFMWTVQEPLNLNVIGIPNIQTFMVQMHNSDLIILKSERNTGDLYAYAKQASGQFEHVAHIAELVTEQRNSLGTNSKEDIHYECDIRELFRDRDDQSRNYNGWSTATAYYGSSTDRNWRSTNAQPPIYWSQNPYFVNYNGYYGSAYQNQSMQYQQAMAQHRQHVLAHNRRTQYLNSLSYGIYNYNCSVNRGPGGGGGRR